jgi:hypothetical protein
LIHRDEHTVEKNGLANRGFSPLPKWSNSPIGINLAPGAQLHTWGSNFGPRVEIKNWPQLTFALTEMFGNIDQMVPKTTLCCALKINQYLTERDICNWVLDEVRLWCFFPNGKNSLTLATLLDRPPPPSLLVEVRPSPGVRPRVRVRVRRAVPALRQEALPGPAVHAPAVQGEVRRGLLTLQGALP